MTSLEVQDVRCVRGGREILRNCSVTLPSASIATVLGPNGAGKTTLLRCIAGLDACHGNIRAERVELSVLDARARARHVAYVPQEFIPAYPCSVLHFVALSRYAYLGVLGTMDDTDEAAVNEALGLLSLDDFRNRNVCTLSGGELRRVLLAAAVAQGTPILLLDEPTAALDPVGQIDTQERLRELVRKRGMTVLQVMHDINLAATSSDLLIGMRDGCISRAAPPREWLCASTLQDLYGRALPLVTVPGRACPAVLP